MQRRVPALCGRGHGERGDAQHQEPTRPRQPLDQGHARLPVRGPPPRCAHIASTPPLCRAAIHPPPPHPVLQVPLPLSLRHPWPHDRVSSWFVHAQKPAAGRPVFRQRSGIGGSNNWSMAQRRVIAHASSARVQTKRSSTPVCQLPAPSTREPCTCSHKGAASWRGLREWMSRFEVGAGNRREVHRLRHTRWKLVAVLCAVAVASTTAIPVRTEKNDASHRAAGHFDNASSAAPRNGDRHLLSTASARREEKIKLDLCDCEAWTCGNGFFLSEDELTGCDVCKPCPADCDAGFWKSGLCTPFSNGCSPCMPCRRGQYITGAPCGGTKPTTCMPWY